MILCVKYVYSVAVTERQWVTNVSYVVKFVSPPNIFNRPSKSRALFAYFLKSIFISQRR